MKLFITVLSLSLIGTASIHYLKHEQNSNNPYIFTEWEVVQVTDGDTLKITKNGITENIRLCGIDAPERSQPLGKESTNYLRLLLSSQKKVQVLITGTDRYNRQIGEVFITGTNPEIFINEEMLKFGMAFHYAQYSNNCPNKIALENAEAMAKQNQVGVWNGNHQKPWDYRREKRSKPL
ncbi:thermonuclease family protein [Nodularia sphaerocarpa]|uniref:thermonuclease family protein n=1 Tax=Nodularia sphaerocarpa TaxID=137816 RepID=UPI00232E62B2|nr:thermonuclease family protein [Nodularia sphaerocarpa]MDB9372354.1 thermonuclease family protein [Nodularia sphaerocarpa CS-585]MDB9377970.1 thermonuclease family protein [Nodularia sphaerocarpa CS-585A2]